MAIQDGQQIEEGSELSCDVCIVGAGAAGITLARALGASGRSVILLEAGDWKASARTQDLYAGQVADQRLHSPPQFYRARRFGGSTTIWSGRCVPYDPLDFEFRDYIPHSGWPFQYAELEPYYRQANKLCEAGEFCYRVRDALPTARPEMIPGFTSDRVETDGLERFSRPTNFAKRYWRELAESSSIRVILNSNCTHVSADRDNQAIHQISVATLDGRHFSVTAKQYVLATGGLEVTRLLLASRDVYAEGIGNEHDLLGRYYMSHIAGTLGRLTFSASRGRDFHRYEVTPDGIYCRRRFQLAPQVQQQLGIANLIARTHHPAIDDPSHRSGPLAALYLARSLMRPEFRKRAGAGGASARKWARQVQNVLTDPIATARFASHWLVCRTLAARKFPSVIVQPRSGNYSLDFHAEQVPNPDSRVQLGDERDQLGMPRLFIDWRYTSQDVRTVRESFRVLAEEFSRTGVARLSFDDAEVEPVIVREGAYGGHHLGTTRMSDDPQQGVVDRDCRVHGLGNLYIASSSVFPTSSQANPTLTIVALALRLAAQLQQDTTPELVFEQLCDTHP